MLQGSIVALITPMKADGLIDQAGLERLVEFHIEQGSDALLAAGTTGESATLNFAEHALVISCVVKQVAGRIPVLAGTGSNATDEAIELTRHAQAAGADACVLVTPYYNKPTQEGLYRHYEKIASCVDIAQILYNVPGRTACDIADDTTVRLSRIDNIVGIKDATGDVARARNILNQADNDFAVYAGDDATGIDLMLAGAHGVISVTANVAPAKMHQMCQLATNGDQQAAQAVDKDLAQLHDVLFAQPNPIPVKWAMCQMGYGESEGIRLPLTWLSKRYHNDVKQAMHQAGVS